MEVKDFFRVNIVRRENSEFVNYECGLRCGVDLGKIMEYFLRVCYVEY